eukprot:CAMPEP_0185801434 /NCGR_PEP_ID=MMETSP1322-20130828/1430_1 /TAXON_ID=265543 /ORGANISM="Minutocellus polymorphus, Strain RCC2270" /LENGTH=391 /DNA_ID=CAMNT_0028497129 /DNA_START=333 /DNA_END=1508 /DNA_ORIENTATION=-
MTTDKNSLEIPITVDGAGKLGINIGRRNSDGAAFVAAVYKSALDGCQDLRPGDLLAKSSNEQEEGPNRTTEAAAASIGKPPKNISIEACDLTLTGRPGRDESYFTSRFNPLGNAETDRTAAELYFFHQFKEYLSTGIRPLRFTAIRTVLSIQIDQPGPLGFAVEEYVPEKKDAKQKFTRVSSVDASHAESSQVQVGDFICYPGSRGSVDIARDLFVNTLSSCRPLYFDVVRPGFRLDAGNKTTGANTEKKKSRAKPVSTPAPTPAAPAPKPKFEPEPVFIGPVNHYQPEPKPKAKTALSAAPSKAKSKAALSAAASKAMSKRAKKIKPTNNTGDKGQEKEDTCCNACIKEVHGTTQDILLSLFQVCCAFALMGKEVDGFVGEIEDARNELQ